MRIEMGLNVLYHVMWKIRICCINTHFIVLNDQYQTQSLFVAKLIIIKMSVENHRVRTTSETLPKIIRSASMRVLRPSSPLPEEACCELDISEEKDNEIMRLREELKAMTLRYNTLLNKVRDASKNLKSIVDSI